MIIKMDSEKLGEIIENTLSHYKFPCSTTPDGETDDSIDLVDLLCFQNELTIEKGKERLFEISDAIIADIILYAREKK